MNFELDLSERNRLALQITSVASAFHLASCAPQRSPRFPCCPFLPLLSLGVIVVIICNCLLGLLHVVSKCFAKCVSVVMEVFFVVVVL